MNKLALCAALITLTAVSTTVRAADEAGFVPLLDGKTLNGWLDDKGEPAKLGTGWAYDADGVLHLTGGSKAGNLLTAKEYGDYILEWDWKIVPGGNNGVKWRVMKYEKGGWLGPEYQMIDDDKHADGKLGGSHTTAAIYLLYDPVGKKVNAPGEWNHSRLVLKGTHVEHYLNGIKVCDAQIGTDDWKSRVAKSKFAKVAAFGENPAGKIMITYHNDETWYRDMKIKELK